MKRSNFCKGVVVGIIILFVGASVIPAIGCIFPNESLFTVNTINKCSTSEDKLILAHNTLDNLTVNVTTDKTKYKRFEPIEVTISVTNNGNEDWNHTFPDTQLADFDINGLYWWSRYKAFPQIIMPITIRSGETKVLLRAYWNQFTNLHYDGWIRLPVRPGNYTIRGWIAFSKLFPIPPFGYSNITIIKSISKSVQQSSLNNNFYQYKEQLFNPFFEHFPNAFPILRHMLEL
jgi:hypothetical protein